MRRTRNGSGTRLRSSSRFEEQRHIFGAAVDTKAKFREVLCHEEKKRDKVLLALKTPEEEAV